MPEKQELRWWVYWLILTIFVGLAVTNIWRTPPLTSANDRSRWATVRALLESHTYVINGVARDPEWDTIDKVLHEGNFYSSKPPMFPTAVAGVTWCVQELFGLTLGESPGLVIPIVLTIINGLGMLIGLLVLIGILERHARQKGTRIALLTVISFGTFLTTFIGTLNNHVPAAICTIFALSALLRMLMPERDPEAPREEPRARVIDFARLGFWSGLLCTFELPAGLFGLFVGIIALRLNWKSALFVLLPMAVIPVAAGVYMNHYATGEWRPMYSFYGTEKYEFVLNGIPSYWMSPEGIDRASDTPLTYLMHCTVGHRGILSLTPIFLLTVLTWIAVPVWQRKGWRVFIPLCLLTTAGILGFYLTRTANYNYGGNSAGLRWTFWLIPIWTVSLIPLLDRIGNSNLFRMMFTTLLTISIFSSVWSYGRPWDHPWLYHVMTRMEWIDYSEPPPQTLPEPRKTWIMQPPSEGGAWVEFEGPHVGGQPSTLRLAVDDSSDAESVVDTVRVVLSYSDTDTEWEETLDLNAERLAEGDFADAQNLRHPRYWLGFQDAKTFEAAGEEYAFSSLRDDAFHCQRVRAAAWNGDLDPNGDSKTYTQCEVWRVPEIPFGVLRVRWTVRDRTTGEIAARQEFNAVRCSGLDEDAALFPPE